MSSAAKSPRPGIASVRPPAWDPRFDGAVGTWLATRVAESDGDRSGGYMPHQRAVAEFLRPETPYRGLVLLHGVGSGKTCAVSAVWTAWTRAGGPGRARLRVVAPASTHANFVATLVRCGHGRWSRSEKEADEGAWVPDARGAAVDDMSDADRASLEAFVRRDAETGGDAFVSVNGLTPRSVRELGGRDRNALDGALVVVDEAHHLARMLYNAATAGDAASASGARGAKAKTPASAVLYDKIRTARRGAKVMILTGTPVHNHPVELAYLVNMAVGVVREYVFRWTGRVGADGLRRARDALARRSAVEWFDASDAFVRVRLRDPDASGGDVGGGSDAVATAAAVAEVGRALEGVGACAFLRRETREAMPTDAAEFAAAFMDDEGSSVRNLAYLTHAAAGAVSVLDAPVGAEGRVPTVTARRVVRLEMSELQARQYARARAHEDKSRASPESTLYKHFSRTTCNFAFPPTSAGTRLMRFERRDMSDAQYARYTADHVRALVRDGLARDAEALRSMSPKFDAIVRRLRESDGKCLVFSSFRAVEGIGLLTSVLIQTGWRQLTVKGDALVTVPRESRGPVFVCPDMSGKWARTLISAFNGSVGELDARAAAQWARLGADVKVVLMSKSGAEGITLKRVRQVHIVEPHWNHALTDQVVGRAVRVDSHAGLPPADRTVEVFTYVCVAPRPRDEGRSERDPSTDEVVLAVADRKRSAGAAVLAALRRAAVDCALWGSGGEDSPCMRRDTAWRETGPRVAVGDARLLRLDGRRIAVFPGDRGVYDGAVWERDKVALVVGSVDSDGNVTWTADDVATASATAT